MAYPHEGIEFEVKKEYSLESLRTKLTWQQWEDRKKQGLIRMLLLRHPVDSVAYCGVEFSDGTKRVEVLAPGVIYNLSPARKEQEMAASPTKDFQARMQKEREAEKAKRFPGSATDIMQDLRQPRKLVTKTVAEIAAAQEEFAEPESFEEFPEGGAVQDHPLNVKKSAAEIAKANNFPSIITGVWGMLCESRDGRMALYLNFDRTFNKFRFCTMDSAGKIRAHHNPVDWEEWVV